LKSDSTSPKLNRKKEKGKEDTSGHINDVMNLSNNITDILKFSAMGRKLAAIDQIEATNDQKNIGRAWKIQVKTEIAKAMWGNEA
jgi:hypothetical protein